MGDENMILRWTQRMHRCRLGVGDGDAPWLHRPPVTFSAASDKQFRILLCMDLLLDFKASYHRR